MTRKITRAVAKIALGLEECMYLGNVSSKRDWGHAKDYVEGMYLMLQQEKANDYVLATGISATIREFAIMAFAVLGIAIKFTGKKEKEVGIVTGSASGCKTREGQVVVRIDPRYYRPTEVDLLIGDASKARKELGWRPRYTLNALVEEMVEHDLYLFKKKTHKSQL